MPSAKCSNRIMDSFAAIGNMHAAVNVLEAAVAAGVVPESGTVAALIGGCQRAGAFELACQVCGPSCSSCMIQMYLQGDARDDVYGLYMCSDSISIMMHGNYRQHIETVMFHRMGADTVHGATWPMHDGTIRYSRTIKSLCQLSPVQSGLCRNRNCQAYGLPLDTVQSQPTLACIQVAQAAVARGIAMDGVIGFLLLKTCYSSIRIIWERTHAQIAALRASTHDSGAVTPEGDAASSSTSSFSSTVAAAAAAARGSTTAEVGKGAQEAGDANRDEWAGRMMHALTGRASVELRQEGTSSARDWRDRAHLVYRCLVYCLHLSVTCMHIRFYVVLHLNGPVLAYASWYCCSVFQFE